MNGDSEMTSRFSRALILAAALIGGHIGAHAAAAPTAASYSVPLGGNAFITHAPSKATELVVDGGLANWTSPGTVVSTYLYPRAAGALHVALVGSLNGASSSTIRVSIGDSVYHVTLSGSAQRTYDVGTVYLAQPGYVKVELQGMSKKGDYFGDISAIQVGGSATDSGVYFANDPANFYWSRRGPSVHLGYTAPRNTEYFYNEVNVPRGEDPVGSYFMANGFNSGYFGMQVNSAKERRMLFSVWDADNGAKTTLVRKGPNVVVNTFGGEGTGGQSYLVFNWVAGHTYKFITRAHPDGAGNTQFSAWFYAPETRAWQFIATWNRPNTNSYLVGNYSFVENFDVEGGYRGRAADYANQWALGSDGRWSEVTSARYDTDATGENKQRMDFAGGVADGHFFLRNGGFFSDTVLDQNFTRPATGIAPDVDVSKLP
jgi:hypothetical protein